MAGVNSRFAIISEAEASKIQEEARGDQQTGKCSA